MKGLENRGENTQENIRNNMHENLLFNFLSALDSIENNSFFVSIPGFSINLDEGYYHYYDGDFWPSMFIKLPEQSDFTTNIEGLFGGKIWSDAVGGGYKIGTFEKERKYFNEMINNSLSKFQAELKEIEKSYLECKSIITQLEGHSNNTE